MSGPTTAEPGERRHPDDIAAGPPGSERHPAPARGPGAARGGWLRTWRLLGPVHRRRLAVFLLVLVLLLGGFCGWALYGSSWFRVERVRVSGTRVLTPEQVRGAAAIGLGVPLASVDTDAVAQRLRRALPRIDSVSVIRSWPHGIGVDITERTPVVLIGEGGKYTEVDAEGVRFGTVATRLKGIPLLELTAEPERGAAASRRRFGPGRLVPAAARVAGDLPAAVARDARVLKVGSYDSISVELSRGRVVLWGSAEQGGEKAASLTALMKAAPDARYFDVSVPTAPAKSGS